MFGSPAVEVGGCGAPYSVSDRVFRALSGDVDCPIVRRLLFLLGFRLVLRAQRTFLLFVRVVVAAGSLHYVCFFPFPRCFPLSLLAFRHQWTVSRPCSASLPSRTLSLYSQILPTTVCLRAAIGLALGVLCFVRAYHHRLRNCSFVACCTKYPTPDSSVLVTVRNAPACVRLG